MTILLVNLSRSGLTSSGYTNIQRGDGPASIVGSSLSVTQDTVWSGDISVASAVAHGFDAEAVKRVWYTGATPAQLTISGTAPVGELLTGVRWVGAASQSSGRTASITINGVTKTYDSSNSGVAPPTSWDAADLAGVGLPFTISVVAAVGSSFGYGSLFELEYTVDRLE